MSVDGIEGDFAAAEALRAFWDARSLDQTDFEAIPNKLSRRRDLHAFLLLEQMLPGTKHNDMIDGADHEIIFLDVSPFDLWSVATEEQLIELRACGVFMSSEYGGLAKFV